MVDYEWTFESDLDSSFDFLLSKPSIEELEALSNEEATAFLAGLFDAEGSILMHNKRGRYNPEVVFTGTEEGLSEYVARTIQALGPHCKLSWIAQREDRNGVTGHGEEGRVGVWRFNDVQRLLQALPPKHAEKLAKKQIVLEMQYRSDQSKNLEAYRAWEAAIARIKVEKRAFIKRAGELVADLLATRNPVN